MLKIVIIEGDKVIARLLENKLIADGHLVRVVFDGASGFKLIKEIKPDLVLLDIMVTGLSGIEIIKELRRDVEYIMLPIIAFSNADDKLDLAIEAGANQVISKNENSFKELIIKIKELLKPLDRHNTITPAIDNAVSSTLGAKGKEIGEIHQRVLIVEDDSIIAEIVKDIIENLGFETVIAKDGREAYRILADDANFAAGVFDVQVPFINGPDLIRHMQSEKRLARIPVMIMTAGQAIQTELDSLSAGAAIFMLKPFKRQLFESLFLTLFHKKNTK